jgi:hypothetical protein
MRIKTRPWQHLQLTRTMSGIDLFVIACNIATMYGDVSTETSEQQTNS